MTCGPCKSIPRYRHTLTVERLKPGLTPDASGHVDKTNSANWSKVGSVRANFRSLGTREFVIGDQVQAQLAHTISVPYTPKAATYTENDRLRMNDRIFNINGPPQNTNEESNEIVFTVVEVPAE
jgi:SPP1 family predicted phage head-tail adaptor